MLERYLDIQNDMKRPYFQLAREIPVGSTIDELEASGLKELLRLHGRALLSLEAESPCGELPAEDAGLLRLKVEIARRMLSACCFCARCCHADRAAGEPGDCGVPALSHVASEFLHYGEEPELVPSHTVFFCGCNFRCIYCQNWDIATDPVGGESVDPEGLARLIDLRREQGARNVNFVGGDPDPHLHTCLETLFYVNSNIPVVWNSNAYASIRTMNLLRGAVDVYLSDFRYGNDICARRYSDAPRYWSTVTRNLGLAVDQAELMIRHLVLPGHLDCCTAPVMEWVSTHLPGVYFNLMFQYRPVYRASRYPEIDRPLSASEIDRAYALAGRYGFKVSG